MSDLTDIYGCHVCGFMKCTCLDKPLSRDEQLTALREACVRANPQIMEPTCGCMVHISNLDGMNKTFMLQDEETIDRIRNNPKIDDLEIFGRPIRLADVLLAIFKVNPDAHVGCYQSGQFWVEQVESGHEWNLYHDSIDQQSDETLAFLYDLLCAPRT